MPERAHERERLLEERRTLLHEIERIEAFLRSEVEFEPEEGDPDLIERDKAASLLASLQERLQEIEDALEHIEEGTYGICERCKQPIPAERLEIMPEARYCVACQEIIERQRRRSSF
ncbi:TraR/DksA family transcriptional regulator [Ardenticatena maritima]|nr:TraR/DksA C4-type zinc finger protein [Ardenticatena maritima]KPL89433.1 hypothetical protein SE16_03015 [Ardenticatena maritima]